MKKLFTAGLILASSFAFAQSAKVVSAYNYNQKGELDKAWENIEAAVQDPKTGIEPKTWKYRFDILMNLMGAFQDPKAPIEYKSLVKFEEIPLKLKESYAKCKEYDTKKKFVEEIEAKAKLMAVMMNNQGIEAYDGAAKGFVAFKDTLKRFNMLDGDKVREEAVTANMEALKQKAAKLSKNSKDEVIKCLDGSPAGLMECLDKGAKTRFQMATMFFAQSVNALDIIGIVDSNNIYSAAVCAELGGLKKEAAELYKECAKIKFNGALPYESAARIYKDLGQKENMLNIIKEGRKEYPTELNLLVSELNYYLETSNYVESEKLLKQAVEADPKNEQMFYVLGVTYDNLANPKDASGKDLAKPANYDELVVKAKDAYKKTLELKPDFFDALYNYGALLFNDGVEFNNKANDLDYRTKKPQIDALNKKADEKFRESLPVFEKALSIKGEDVSVLQSLKQLYVRLEMTDKYNEVKKKLEGK